MPKTPMPIIKYIIFILFTSLFAFQAHAGPQEIVKIREKYKLPGIAAATVIGDEIDLFTDGVRKWNDRTPLNLMDRFHLGSCTKAMTATVLAILIERGYVTWETTLAHIFPDIAPSMHKDYLSVTLEMLGAHRSGIPAVIEGERGKKLWEKLMNPSLDVREGRRLVTTEVLTTAPASTPGSRFEYANSNYIILGAVLERLTGKSWETLIKRELFEPLGMSSCGFGVAASQANPPDGPLPHQWANSNPSPINPGFNADNPPTVAPAGTVHCSMVDWAKFVKLHTDGFNNRSSLILTSFSFRKLHESYPGQSYTYGGWIREFRPWARGDVLTHAGTNTVNYATVWIAPELNMSFLTATNIGGEAAAKALNEITVDMAKTNQLLE